jgi:extracellular elastinolytic metalloproteinase
MSTSTSRRRLAALASAALAAAGLMVIAPSASGKTDPHAVEAKTRVHWSNGKALGVTGKGADAVRNYLAGKGLGRATADSLRGTASWTSKGVTYLRLEQYVGNLRVVDSDIKAALDKQGRLISVVENATRVGWKPAAARVTPEQAKSAAISSIYQGRAVSYLQAPTVERVAIPMSDNSLAEGFTVTTWDTDNQLRETVVDGKGAVVESVSRTAEDGYNVFPEAPDKGAQQLELNPADPVASESGWLSGLNQYVDDITGNNAHAYLDVDDNNKPDPVGPADTDGVFDKVFNPSIQPSAGDNKAVAVQNLFYLNNKIHDLLYLAGFNEAAGNFQTDNFGRGGRGGDPVLAEAQDGGGTDNANFATPRDGASGRMQMYLWSVPGTSVVAQGASSYDAAVAEFSAPLTAAGATGPLALANDGTGVSPTDACENIAAVAAGSFVIADRGNCDFVVKAANIKAAGAGGMIVANQEDGAPFVMGGTVRKFGIPAVMVSKAHGAALKVNVGTATTIRLVDPPPPMRDGDLDSDIVYHEYGHGLTWRMIGQMSGAVAGGIGEGMADVLSVIINDDPVVGEYSTSDPIGIRTASYEGYLRSYADIPFTQVHNTGELYGAIGWDLWKRYKTAGLDQSDILFDLIQGMNFTPAKPSFEEMRDGILQGLVANTHETRTCMVWDAFAAYGVGVGSSAKVSGGGAAVVESFDVPSNC